jgi:hypothetical protein
MTCWRSIRGVVFARAKALSRPFRAMVGCAWSQGGARRLRRLALPWAKLLMPLRGVADPLRGRVLAWRPSLRFGLAVNDGAPGPRGIRTAGRPSAYAAPLKYARLPPLR